MANRDDMGAVVDRHHSQDSTAGVSMIRFKSQLAGCAAVAALSLAGFYLSPANGAAADASQPHPATGVGSCTLKNPHPKPSAHDLKMRIQTYRPDNYDCDGATTPGTPSKASR
jgi:hypothetical protein